MLVKLNSVPIRISKISKEKLDFLMQQEIKVIFEEGNKFCIGKILRRGYSYAEFIDKLIDVYNVHNSLSITKDKKV